MSNPTKRGLGKGLGALIPTDTTPRVTSKTKNNANPPTETAESGVPAGPAAVYAELPLDSIVPNPRQPRAVFEQEALAELVYSIKEIGLLQPVVV
ncbi:MAG: chromosome partitioning protein ParB, partial [Actinobacteria bacterium]|nr:chromosome partitioning protein ParB [Actinomycetota bacterium]